jgi:hypothetical protein
MRTDTIIEPALLEHIDRVGIEFYLRETNGQEESF